MKITIDIEISDEVLLEAIKKGEALEDFAPVLSAIQTNIGLKLKADAAKILLEVCKQQNVPLADLLSSKD